MLVEAAVLRIIPTPARAAARATARSPSSCTMLSTPTGASSTGALSSVPRISVRRSRSATPRSMRGTIRQRSNAARLWRTVRSSPAAPAT